MINVLCSVSPNAAAAPAPSTPEGRPWDAVEEPDHAPEQDASPEEEEVDFRHAMTKDPIVGVELTILDQKAQEHSNHDL